MIFPSRNNYYMSPRAIVLNLNALGDPDTISISVYAGALVSAYVPGIIDFTPSDEYYRWTIVAFPTHFEDHDVRYMHLALSRDGSIATICYPSTPLDIYGNPITEAQARGDEPADTESEQPADGSSDGSYYIFLAKITSSGEYGTTNRELRDLYGQPVSLFPSGSLDTDRYHEEEQKGEWTRMFRIAGQYIEQLLPILTSRIRTLLLGSSEKPIRDLYTTLDNDDDLPPSDAIVPSEAHMRQYAHSHFLSKVNDDTAAGRIIFGNGVVVRAHEHDGICTLYGDTPLQEGVSGAGVWVDQNGNYHAQFDYIRANMRLEATEVEIQEEKHIGGATILTGAGCTLYAVSADLEYIFYDSELLPVRKCYFLASDGERSITNDWRIGDQARSQSFNLDNPEQLQRFLWRLVLGVSSEAEDLNGTMCHYIYIYAGDNAHYGIGDLPAPDDDVFLLGSRARMNDGSYDLTRQHAIILAGAGSGSPYIREYKGIDTFTLAGKCRIDLNPMHPVLDVAELTITAEDEQSTNVSETIKNMNRQLEESFVIWHLEQPAPVDDEGNVLNIVPLQTEGFPDIEWNTDSADLGYTSHLGDIALTTDGICYKFIESPVPLLPITPLSTEPELGADAKAPTEKHIYVWSIVTDRYLIDYVNTSQANAATLNNMGSDNVITRQEKGNIRTLYASIQAEYSAMMADAQSSQVSTGNYAKAFGLLNAFFDRFVNQEPYTDTLLVDGEMTLMAYAIKDPVTNASVYNLNYVSQSGGSSQLTIGVTYREAVVGYYRQLGLLQNSITRALRNEILSIATGGSISEQLSQKIDKIYNDFNSMVGDAISANTAIMKINEDLSVLTNWAKNGTETIGSGFVTESDFASIFTRVYQEDDQIKTAFMSTFVSRNPDGTLESNAEIYADRVRFSAEHAMSLRAGYLTITSGNFLLDEFGNVTCHNGNFEGSINATRGYIGGIELNITRDASGNVTRTILNGVANANMWLSSFSSVVAIGYDVTSIMYAGGIWNGETQQSIAQGLQLASGYVGMASVAAKKKDRQNNIAIFAAAYDAPHNFALLGDGDIVTSGGICQSYLPNEIDCSRGSSVIDYGNGQTVLLMNVAVNRARVLLPTLASVCAALGMRSDAGISQMRHFAVRLTIVNISTVHPSNQADVYGDTSSTASVTTSSLPKILDEDFTFRDHIPMASGDSLELLLYFAGSYSAYILSHSS